eukprot:gene1101-10615_t
MSVENVRQAICNGNINKLEELIKKGFEIDKQYPHPLGCNQSYGDSIPWTPLQYAAAIERQDVIDFLVENRADISIVDKTGRTAQEIADFLEKDIDVKKFIKEQQSREKMYSMKKLFDIKFNFKRNKRKIIEVEDNENLRK